MKIQSILVLFVLYASSYTVAAKRLGEETEENEGRELQERVPDKRINWGDGLDNIGDGGFFDDVKDGIGDFLDNITDIIGDPDFGDNLGDGLGDFLENITDGLGDLGDGLGDLIGDFNWPDNWPNLNDGVADWENFTNWPNFDFDNFTWDLIDWDDGSWSDFRGDIDLGNPDIDFCSILESAVGIGKGFGIEGDCRCKDSGDLAIGCDFQNECYNSSSLCGEVSLNFTMGNEISVSSCVDLENDSYPEVCFDYSYNMSGQGSQTCSASYGGNSCECSIDGFCINLNCSMFLPGAAFDSCQLLETVTSGDIVSWLPEFPAFNDNFTQIFDNIDWGVIDWQNLDTDNFKIDEIEWGSNARERRFGDIINVDPADDVMCPILQSFIGMSSEFSSSGGCTCGASDGDAQGLSMDCKFENACVDEQTCASIGVSFEFAKLGGVQTETCVNFANDGHPETCFVLDVDVAETSAPTCSATYGGKQCKCSIENLCVAVDCSEHEPSAVVDTCQQINFSDMEPISFIPRFAERRDPNDLPPNNGGIGNENGDSTNRAAESSATTQRLASLAILFVLVPILL